MAKSIGKTVCSTNHELDDKPRSIKLNNRLKNVNRELSCIEKSYHHQICKKNTIPNTILNQVKILNLFTYTYILIAEF